MQPDPHRELRRLKESQAFSDYTELRRVCMCYDMMDSKLSELLDAVVSARSSGIVPRMGFAELERASMELCQLLSDFLNRMYSCKNLASVCAKRHGADDRFRALKREMLGPGASVMVNLRNYAVHVDIMPLEIDPRSGRVVFTKRCRGDAMWSADQRRFLRTADLESFLLSYRDEIRSFYGEYFAMIRSSARPRLAECRREISELNGRMGYEVVRYEAIASQRV